MFINDLKMQGSNAVAESTDHKAGTEASTDGLREARQEALDVDEGRASGVTGFVADKVKDGARKAVETAENVGDTAKQTMDGAWKAAKETTEKIKDKVICGDDGDRDHIDRDPSVFEAKKTSDPIDTQEYRSIEDQRNKAVLKKKKNIAVSEQLKIIKLSQNGNSITTELKQQQKLIKQLLEIVETTTNKRKKKN